MINNITNNEATAIKKFSKIMLRAVLVEDTWSIELYMSPLIVLAKLMKLVQISSVVLMR